MAQAHIESALAALGQDPETVEPYRRFLWLIGRWVLVTMRDELPRPVRLLDVGCGAGAYGELLDRCFPGRFVYTGADLPVMVEEARRVFPERQFVGADAMLFQPPLDGYDVILASGLLVVLREPWPPLHWLLGAPAPLVIVHRQPVGAERSVRRDAYGRHNVETTMSFDRLDAAAAEHGREMWLHGGKEPHKTLTFERHARPLSYRARH